MLISSVNLKFYSYLGYNLPAYKSPFSFGPQKGLLLFKVFILYLNLYVDSINLNQLILRTFCSVTPSNYSRGHIDWGRVRSSQTIRKSDLRVFEKFQWIFLTKCNFSKFAAYERVILVKLLSTTDERLGIFQNFSGQRFLRKVLDASVF